MRKRVVIDGTPDEVKVSCPVWRGGKSGDNLKGLPITIGQPLRRLRPGQSDRGGTVQIFGQPDGNERQYLPRKKRSQPVPPDDGASPHDPG